MARSRRQSADFFERKQVQARLHLRRMDPEPHPTEAPTILTATASATVRNLCCARYSACLDYAFSHRWDGFNCDGCRAFQPLKQEDFLADMEGLANLFVVVARGYRSDAALVKAEHPPEEQT